MLPIEMYWPPEMLARVFPKKYPHLVEQLSPPRKPEKPHDPRYTIERLAGGCVVYWLSRTALENPRREPHDATCSSMIESRLEGADEIRWPT